MNEPYTDELDFTVAAWESLYDAVDDTVFLEQDAELIYRSLQHRLRFISFGDYLKRYIYRKAELEGSFSQVPIKEYQVIIRTAFSDNQTPPSFTPTTAKLSALSKNWLTQQTVKRSVVFLLGFGLGMSVEDVNLFLTKALREPEINPKDPFEVICWYCFKHRYSYRKFEQLWTMYQSLSTQTQNAVSMAYGDRTVGIRNSMYALQDDASLMMHVAKLKEGHLSRMSVTAKERFDALYREACVLIAAAYNRREDEAFADALDAYKAKLSQNERLFDYEKQERLRRFREQRRVFSVEDISESDMEQMLCAAIPKDHHGNLTPSKASKLNAQFAGKRFSRQRISEVLAGHTEVTRFDLITLNFFVYSQKLSEYPDAKRRYVAFLESTNEILAACSMGGLYVQNPYECFVLMCILSLDPLATYADVWELSYDEDKNEI